ncbi:hypothetical protein MTR67_008894 [Solanum verrucosum]|uniref:Uncharacterized protein n=1 Tax=Solanum verrucosum TaxID=315347 RepID=A0AAF0Q290_SOLVR|nr:hypothetical protein MTR67_008894 [Solanum verrucosum]
MITLLNVFLTKLSTQPYYHKSSTLLRTHHIQPFITPFFHKTQG